MSCGSKFESTSREKERQAVVRADRGAHGTLGREPSASHSISIWNSTFGLLGVGETGGLGRTMASVIESHKTRASRWNCPSSQIGHLKRPVDTESAKFQKKRYTCVGTQAKLESAARSHTIPACARALVFGTRARARGVHFLFLARLQTRLRCETFFGVKRDATADDKRFMIEKDKCVMLETLGALELPFPDVRVAWRAKEYSGERLKA